VGVEVGEEAVIPHLAQLKLAAVEHAMLVNDLLSYRWECFKGDSRRRRSPPVTSHLRGLDHGADAIAQLGSLG